MPEVLFKFAFYLSIDWLKKIDALGLI